MLLARGWLESPCLKPRWCFPAHHNYVFYYIASLSFIGQENQPWRTGYLWIQWKSKRCEHIWLLKASYLNIHTCMHAYVYIHVHTYAVVEALELTHVYFISCFLHMNLIASNEIRDLGVLFSLIITHGDSHISVKCSGQPFHYLFFFFFTLINQ